MGYAVKRGKLLDNVRVPIPRCAACQWRYRVMGAILVTSPLIGAFSLPALMATFWPHVAPPKWAQESFMLLGSVLGLLITALGIALYRKLRDDRSTNGYLPVAKLLKLGWSYPRGD